MGSATHHVLSELFPALEFEPRIGSLSVVDLTLDSRKVVPGSVFFAVTRSQVNGEKFIGDAFAKGAVAVICAGTGDHDIGVTLSEAKNSQFKPEEFPEFQVRICVKEFRDSMGFAAHRFFGEPSNQITLVGITGTNGKTSCAHLLSQIWRGLGYKAASLGTLGWSTEDGVYNPIGLTTLDVIENHRVLRKFVDSGITHVVMEVSSHGIDQQRIEYLNFDVRALTNITRDHLDYHPSMDHYAETKLGFLIGSDLNYVFNAQDDETMSRIDCDKEAVGLSIAIQEKNQGHVANDFCAEDTHITLDGFEFKLNGPGFALDISVPLLGRFNVFNVLTVIAVLHLIEGDSLNKEILKEAVASLKPVPGRLERMAGGRHIFIDYAHTPDALESVLSTLSEHCTGELILVFGCGGDRDKGKRPIMASVAERYANKIILTTDNPRFESPEAIIKNIYSGFRNPEKVVVHIDRKEAISFALRSAKKCDVVLIAGKGHETYQDVCGEKLAFSDVEQVQRLIA